VRITADTNILVRAVVRDDEAQADAAANLLRQADIIAVPLPCLCELVWVLRRFYRIGTADIASAIEALLGAGNVVVNRPAAEAGLAALKAGGDFADGAIAHEGAWLGGEVFISFDKAAVSLLSALGRPAQLLA